MSTEYENLASTRLTAYEHSTKIDLYVTEVIEEEEKVIEHYIANDLNASQLCHLAEELIKIASYVSDDPERLLAAYNVDYNRPNYTKVK